MRIGRASIAVTVPVAAGLFVARVLGELVPDALAIAVAMFPAGMVAGFWLCLSLGRGGAAGGAKRVGGALDGIGRWLRDEEHEDKDEPK